MRPQWILRRPIRWAATPEGTRRSRGPDPRSGCGASVAVWAHFRIHLIRGLMTELHVLDLRLAEYRCACVSVRCSATMMFRR